MLTHLELPAPQQARAQRTRSQILDATITSLMENGVTKTTTTAIAKTAGVSQGALYKHFPSKPLLLAAATEHLFVTMREAFVPTLLQRAEQSPHALEQLCFDLLWENYSDPRIQGVFSLYIAARTEPDLHTLLEPIVSVHFDAILAMARMLYADGASQNPHFDDTVHAILLTLHGAALMTDMFPNDAPNITRRIIERLALAELGKPSLEAFKWKKP